VFICYSAMISEEIENELEALRAIYGDDFEEREPVWKRPCFCIKVKPTTSVNGEIHVEANVKFTLVNGYPRVPPKVELEATKGLTGSDVKALNAKLVETATVCTGQEMCHDLISATQVFLEANNIKPQTFYEAMVSREKRETEALKKLRGKELSSDGKKEKDLGMKMDTEWERGVKAPALGSLPTGGGGTGAIAAKMENVSLLESTAHDFRQSTEFINQQRLLNKSVRGDKGAKTVLPNQTNSTADSQSTLSTTSPMRPGAASGAQNWAKLFINQPHGADDDDGDDENEEEEEEVLSNNDGKKDKDREGASKNNNSAMGDIHRLVPVIGRAPPSSASAAVTDNSSRYGQEFEEMAPLGSGASGQVWKVRNKLDRRIYAIKKIDLNAAENASVGQAKIRREVTTISRLLHKHIVRYYAAWVEESQQHPEQADQDGDHSRSTLSVGGSESRSSSVSSSPIKGALLAGAGTPAYLSNAYLGGKNNNNFMMGGDFDDIFEHSEDGTNSNSNSKEVWDYDQTEISSPARTPGGTVAAKPVKGSRFYNYGSSSSSDSESEGDEEDDSSDSSSDESGSDSDGSSSSSGGEDGGVGSDSSDMLGRDSEVTVDRNSALGIAAGSNALARNRNASAGSAMSGKAAGAGSSGRRIIPKSSAGPKLRRWMFIQMEYCFTTLREKIDGGQLWQQPAECGKLLRQLLEALAYIHDRRVIHRDLKPANIFLDGEGNIKIGDFGLATFNPETTVTVSIAPSGSSTNLYNLRDAASPLGQTDDSLYLSREVSSASLSQLDQTGDSSAIDAMLSNSLTGGIGTAMYRAPEQEFRPKEAISSTDRGYDEKADMFSLGIILFEMCHAPFGTGMERLLTMKKLRDNAELPAGFGESYSTEALCSIVRWLVQQQPSQRPSAVQLLESPLLPARVDTDSKYLKEITEALWKPNSTAAAGIISVLFNNSFSVQKGLTAPMPPVFSPKGGLSSKAYQDSIPAVSYDLEILQQNLNLLQPRPVPKAALLSLPAGVSKAIRQQLRQVQQKERSVVSLQYFSAVKQQLKEVFEAHGAVPYAPGLLQLRSNPGLALMMRNADQAAARLLGTTEDKLNISVKSPALAQFLDPVGQVVVLPSDLVTPYAKLIAFLNLQQSQRYNISQVFTSLVPVDNAAPDDYLSMPPDSTTINQDHPFISEEAVYDVVLPHSTHSSAGSTPSHCAGDASSAAASTLLQADFEVLTAAIEAMSRLQPYLPDCAVRVSDPRIMDSIIEICAWQLQPLQDPAAPAGGKAKGKKNANDSNDGTFSGIDRGALCKVISLASDGVMTQGELVHLVSELRLPPLFQKRILPFLSVLSSQQDRRAASSSGSYLQQGTSTGKDPLQILDALEQEFYRSEIILDIQRRLASGNTSTSAPAPASNTSDITSAGPGSTQVPAKGKGKNSKETTAVVTAKGPAVEKDFTPLDLAAIGTKQVQKKKASNTPGSSAVSNKPAETPVVADPCHHEEQDDPFREDRRRIRSIIKTFDASLNHLRQLLKAALNCLYGAQQSAAASGASALLVLVDLGKDPRYVSSRTGSSNLCPFHARGVYFVIESYLFPSEQFLAQQLQLAKEKEKERAKTGLASGQVSSDLALRCSRRRHNRFGGVLGEGGHFDHLVEAYREHFQQVGGGEGPGGAEKHHEGKSRSSVIACALRLKLDAISLLISKFEARQHKIAEHLWSRGTSSKYFFVDRFKADLARLLDSAQCLDALVVVDGPSGGAGPGSREDSAAAAYVLQNLLVLLRRHGVRASDRPHQLQGASRGLHQHLDATVAGSLCSELGIPFAVLARADAGSKAILSYCGDHASETQPDKPSSGATSSQHSLAVSVNLVDLPRVLKECVRAHNAACTKGKFSFLAVVAAAVDTSPGARSPGRYTAAASGSATGTSAAATSSGAAEATGGSNASSGNASSVAAANAANKNQRVRFGSFDIKNPANTNTDSADAQSTATNATTPGGRVSAGATEKSVVIVFLDAVNSGPSGAVMSERHSKDWQQFSNPKEKKQAMVKKKEQDHVPNKVRLILAGYAASGMMGMGDAGAAAAAANNLTTTVRTPGSPYVPGVVLVVDAPFAVLRNLSTILLTRLHSALSSSTAREEYEALAATNFSEHQGATGGGSSANYRKQLKQVVSQLCSYAKQATATTQTSSSASLATKQSAGTSTASGAAPAGASNLSSVQSGVLHVYLYSMSDNQLDFLCCDGRALLSAKLI